MNQNKDTKPEPKSIIWGTPIQFKLIFSNFILDSLKFCALGKGVRLGENIQLKIKSRNDININLFIERIYINQHDKMTKARQKGYNAWVKLQKSLRKASKSLRNTVNGFRRL